MASLTVLGSIIAVDPSTPEITDILCRSSVVSCKHEACDTASTPELEHKICRQNIADTKWQHSSNQDSDYDDVLEDNTDVPLESSSGGVTNQMSWLLEVCLKNLQQPSTKEGTSTMLGDGDTGLLPCSAPVKVESLQVLTILARNYFIQVMSRHLDQLMQLLGQTLSDGNVTICLHSGRVIDALGNSMQQCLQEQGKD